jgi:hypothetical protein
MVNFGEASSIYAVTIIKKGKGKKCNHIVKKAYLHIVALASMFSWGVLFLLPAEC